MHIQKPVDAVATAFTEAFNVTEDKTQPRPESRDFQMEPLHNQHSRWGRRLLGVGIAIVAGAVVLVWGTRLYPQTLPEPLPEVALITSAVSLFLVVPAAVAGTLAAFAWRIGWRCVAGATAAISLLLLLGVILPWAT